MEVSALGTVQPSVCSSPATRRLALSICIRCGSLAVDKSSYEPFSELGVLRRRKERIAPDCVTEESTPE
jgi:hypothetical protein